MLMLRCARGRQRTRSAGSLQTSSVMRCQCLRCARGRQRTRSAGSLQTSSVMRCQCARAAYCIPRAGIVGPAPRNWKMQQCTAKNYSQCAMASYCIPRACFVVPAPRNWKMQQCATKNYSSSPSSLMMMCQCQSLLPRGRTTSNVDLANRCCP